MASSSQTHHIAAEAAVSEDGSVYCPVEGCGRLLGKWETDHAQWFCHHCKAEVQVRPPTTQVAYRSERFAATVSNSDPLALLSVLVAAQAESGQRLTQMTEIVGFLIRGQGAAERRECERTACLSAT